MGIFDPTHQSILLTDFSGQTERKSVGFISEDPEYLYLISWLFIQQFSRFITQTVSLMMKLKKWSVDHQSQMALAYRDGEYP